MIIAMTDTPSTCCGVVNFKEYWWGATGLAAHGIMRQPFFRLFQNANLRFTFVNRHLSAQDANGVLEYWV